MCYGLGNFATCVIARNQLTFLLLFLEKCQVKSWVLICRPSGGLARGAHADPRADETPPPLPQIPRRRCCVYDPLFSQLELEVLDRLGVTVLRENEVSGGGGGAV